MNYGVPYKGSKNKIAEWVVGNLPEAENFYDLFAGGCAVTHAALLSGKYQHCYANDIWTAPKLFLDAISGKYRNKTRWISREEFFEKRLTDPYIQFCWSFGNGGQSYMYSREIEEAKHALHKLVFFNDYADFDKITKTGFKYSEEEMKKPFYERYMVYKKFRREKLAERKELVPLQLYQRLESLESLESLQRLQRLQSLEVSQGSYENVVIKPDSVIYCDIPYKGTEGYESLMKAHCHPSSSLFDYDSFYEWCGKQTELVVVSEYSMPEDFICVGQKEKLVTNCAIQTIKATERLFVPRHQIEKYNAMMKENTAKKPAQLELDFISA